MKPDMKRCLICHEPTDRPVDELCNGHVLCSEACRGFWDYTLSAVEREILIQLSPLMLSEPIARDASDAVLGTHAGQPSAHARQPFENENSAPYSA